MGPAAVILADPDARTRAALGWLLRERGHHVLPVSTPDDLPQALGATAPDLVVLGFEGADARRALAHVVDDPHGAELPVLATVEGALGDGTAFGLGPADVIARPIQVPQFLARVDAQLRLRQALRDAWERSQVLEAELARAREEAAATQEVVAIVHEIIGESSATTIYRVLARRLARMLGIARCSIVLAGTADGSARVAAAHDDPLLQDLPIELADYPEVESALELDRPVLVEDARHDPRMADVAARRPGVAQLRSALVLPFSLDRWRRGALLLRTVQGERVLGREDLELAEPLLRAAVATVRRSQVLESAKADNQRLEALATTDPLTRLLNRRALHDRLATEVERAHRYGASVTLLMLDVDHFKAVNDTYGHLVGDTVLAQLAALLQASLRTVDVAARYGGEEFVAILPETATDGGTVIAERLRERLARHEFAGAHGAPLRLTASVGVATYPGPDVRSTDDLLARADAALYRAKAGGRNKVCT